MIVNLNLRGRSVVVVGGGGEALKRIRALLGEQCSRITVVSDAADPRIGALAKEKRIELEEQRVQDMGFFARHIPDLVITTTDDRALNQKIVSHARKKRIMAYSSDDPESSDFANLAVVDVEDAVRIAIFTGGESPAVAKKLKTLIRRDIKRIVPTEYIGQIKVQRAARRLAKEKISSHRDRRAFLASLMGDKEIEQLIKDGMLKKAESRAVTILGDWG